MKLLTFTRYLMALPQAIATLRALFLTCAIAFCLCRRDFHSSRQCWNVIAFFSHKRYCCSVRGDITTVAQSFPITEDG